MTDDVQECVDGSESDSSEVKSDTKRSPVAGARKRRRTDPHRFVEDAAQDVSVGKMVERKVVCTGNAMIDQFEPWYFGVAFAFVFQILHWHARQA